MDYEAEKKRLEEGGNYWKPKAGTYTLKALSELEDAEPFIKKREGQEDEVHPQLKMKIKLGEEEKTWTFGKGKTPASTHGQLVELAIKHANALTNVEFKVVVKNDGTKNDYTIVD